MKGRSDTIAALATPLGVGALAIIRVSGKSVFSLIGKILIKTSLIHRKATLTKIVSFDKQSLLDECLVVYFKGPDSFTGEDVLEISCHGGRFVPRSILNEVLLHNIRIADPGEFSYRAFLNGKIDLVQAEAISSLISSKTNLSASVELSDLSGRLSKFILGLRNKILNILSLVEHEIDFIEEGFDLLKKRSVMANLGEISSDISNLLQTSSYGCKLKTGFRVVLLGKPNSGKSTVFNHLVGHDRAIVSNVPGTTLDTIEAWFDLDGYPVCLVDTAGFWEGRGSVESLGIERTKREAINADIILFVDENSPTSAIKQGYQQFNFNKSIIFIKSKEDLNPSKTIEEHIVYTSSNISMGFNDLYTSISTSLTSIVRSVPDNDLILTSDRQKVLISLIKKTLDGLIDQHEKNRTMDMLSSDLKDIANMFGEITGEITTEETLNNIFSNFCVGK